MATGFSDKEERLGRLVGKALAAGVPEQAYGLGGKRTVGPLVTLQTRDGKPGYCTNGTPGMYLGRTEAEAAATIRAEYRAFVETPRSRA